MDINLSPVGTAWQRRANLSSYLVGCPNTLAHVIAPNLLLGRHSDHLFTIGRHEYLSFACAEDRRRYTLGKIQRDAYRFFTIGFLADTLMVHPHQVLEAVSGDPSPEERRRAINNLIDISCSWKILLKASIEKHGYQVLLGGLDQMGCPWEETDTNPQLVFRIAAGSIEYSADEKRNTNKLPLDKKDQA